MWCTLLSSSNEASECLVPNVLGPLVEPHKKSQSGRLRPAKSHIIQPHFITIRLAISKPTACPRAMYDKEKT